MYDIIYPYHMDQRHSQAREKLRHQLLPTVLNIQSVIYQTDITSATDQVDQIKYITCIDEYFTLIRHYLVLCLTIRFYSGNDLIGFYTGDNLLIF